MARWVGEVSLVFLIRFSCFPSSCLSLLSLTRFLFFIFALLIYEYDDGKVRDSFIFIYSLVHLAVLSRHVLVSSFCTSSIRPHVLLFSLSFCFFLAFFFLSHFLSSSSVSLSILSRS